MTENTSQTKVTGATARTDLSARQAAAMLVGVWLVLFGEFLWVTYDYHGGIGIWGHDPLEYYGWLRSPLIDGDLDFQNEYTEFDYSNSISPTGWLLRMRTPKGLHYNATGIGCALLWSPFFALASLLSWVVGMPVDGFNPVFQFLVPFGSLAYAGLGIGLTYKICRLCLDRWSSVLGTAGVFLGTTVTFVSAHLAMLSHLPAIAVTALFMLVALRTAERRPIRYWMLLGALLALVTMVRIPMAILGIVFPVQSAIRILGTARSQRWQRFGEEMLGWLAAAVAGFVTFIPQLIAWKALFGSFIVSSYGDPTEIFNFGCPNFLPALFSWDHGVVVWTPIVGLAIAGLLASGVSRCWQTAVPLLAIALLLWYVVGCCRHWNFAEVYGNRGFSEASPAFAFGLGFLWQRWRLTGAAVTAIAILQNHVLIWAYQNDYCQKVSSYADIFNAYMQIITHAVGKLVRLIGLA